MTKVQIPEGYREDAQGRLVPERNIAPADLLRDELVRGLVTEVEDVAGHLARIKAALFKRVAEHIALVASEYEVNLSGKDGNVTLASYDGRYKVERVSGERIIVGEQIHAAIALVREVLDEIDDPQTKAIVDRAYRRNQKTGEVSATRVVDQILGIEIDDARWRRAQDAVRDAQAVAGTTTYFRAYRRAQPTDSWQQIPLDFSRLPPATEGGEAVPSEAA